MKRRRKATSRRHSPVDDHRVGGGLVAVAAALLVATPTARGEQREINVKYRHDTIYPRENLQRVRSVSLLLSTGISFSPAHDFVSQ